MEQIVKGVSYEQFIDDIRIYYSVMKNIEVIGEAANMLTRHFRETHAELPWRLIVSMRNVLVHGYAQVSDADLWQTAVDSARRMMAKGYSIADIAEITCLTTEEIEGL